MAHALRIIAHCASFLCESICAPLLCPLHWLSVLISFAFLLSFQLLSALGGKVCKVGSVAVSVNISASPCENKEDQSLSINTFLQPPL